MRSRCRFIVTLALVGAACAPDADSTGPSLGIGSDVGDGGEPGRPGSSARFVRALTPFDDCRALLDHVQAMARERVGPYGLEGVGASLSDETAAAGVTADAEAGDDSGGSHPPPTDHTGTNVQESGVDEPDIVKTDGDRILAVSDGVLTYVDLTGGAPTVTDRLRLPGGWGHELFISGDRALVLASGGVWDEPMPLESADAEADFATTFDDTVEPGYSGPVASVFEIDLSDPSHLAIAASMRIDGEYLSARAIGDSVRLALASGPNDLPWVYPASPNGEERATDANRQVIDQSTLEDWVPSFQLTAPGHDDAGPLLACDRLHRPAEFSGFEVISIIDLSLGRGLADGFVARDAVGVLAGGRTVYSSTERFYVATTTWANADLASDAGVEQLNDDYETDVHAFAIAPEQPTEYVASGTVPGTLLNQFSLDEHDEHLRVITTDGSPWNEPDLSETQLVVLEEQGDRLAEVGRVGGLGRGEQLYSARLMDDVGFAVTFRQVDPFYVLDLSDPREPRLSGELKIPGFSTYLHPLGDHRVLGVGQEATEDGATTGLKLGLYDVSDPAAPREVGLWTMPGASSPVESDHRAFQVWGTTAIVPVQSTGFNGAILFDLSDGITEIGRITPTLDGIPLASDCRPLEPASIPQESELAWMANDGQARIQVCGPDDTGGWNGSSCERIPGADIVAWFWERAEEQVAALGIGADDVVEICWPNQPPPSITRSLVVGDDVWTMTWAALQANRLDSLEQTASLPLH